MSKKDNNFVDKSILDIMAQDQDVSISPRCGELGDPLPDDVRSAVYDDVTSYFYTKAKTKKDQNKY